MRLSTTIIGLVSWAAPAVTINAPTLKVEVGPGNELSYNPASFDAPVGSKVEFHFFPKNHSVIQSSFGDPCHPLGGDGFFSGFIPTVESPSKTTFTIIVKDLKPVWFYCGQSTHCQNGMVGAINAPKTGNTFETFIHLAQTASNSTSPYSGPAGGVLGSDNTNSLTEYLPTSPTTTSLANGLDDQGWPTLAATHLVFTLAPAPTRTTRAYTTEVVTIDRTRSGQVLQSTATTTLVTIENVSPDSTQFEIGSFSTRNGASEVTGVPAHGLFQAAALVVAAAAAIL